MGSSPVGHRRKRSKMNFVRSKSSTMTAEQIDLLEDKLIDSLFLMKSHWYVVALIGSYLYFTLKLGPKLMANRPPFDLKYIMIVYNSVQLVINTAFPVLFFSKPHIVQYLLEQSCHPSYTRPLDYRIFCIKMAWMWLVMKVLDLVDTIFLVLRKKQSHVSFLHVYHHTTLVISVWLYLKYVRGEQASIIAIANSIVHFFMYLYYLLAALGPRVQKQLWWKKYITKLQMLQFWIVTAFFLTLTLVYDLPPMQKMYNYWVISQGILFTALFLNFYFKTYAKKPDPASTAQTTNKQKIKKGGYRGKD